MMNQAKAGLIFVKACGIAMLLAAAFVIGFMVNQYFCYTHPAEEKQIAFEVQLTADGKAYYTTGTTTVWYCTECGQWHLSQEGTPCGS